MDDNTTCPTPESIKRFGDNYRKALEKPSTPKGARPWYGKHVERFVGVHPDTRRRDTRMPAVHAYLEDIGRIGRRVGCLICQSAGALEILFCGLLNMPWCRQIE